MRDRDDETGWGALADVGKRLKDWTADISFLGWRYGSDPDTVNVQPVTLGSIVVPSHVTARFTRVGSEREIELELHTSEAGVGVDAITFRGFKFDAFPRQPLAAMRDYALTKAAFDLTSALAGDQWSRRAEIHDAVRRHGGGVPVAKLREAIEHYAEGGVQRIVDRMDVSRATAYRWIRQARDLGLIGEG